jgi:hypothetical protein
MMASHYSSAEATEAVSVICDVCHMAGVAAGPFSLSATDLPISLKKPRMEEKLHMRRPLL